MRRVLVTGSRELVYPVTVAEVLDRLVPDVVVVGDCQTGADRFARQWAGDERTEEHKADWKASPRGGGVIRNQAMVDSGADLALAFYRTDAKNNGTADCVRRCQAAGIPVMEFWE